MAGLAAALLVVALSARDPAAFANPRASTACTPSWKVVARGARVPPLSDVDAVSANDVWAVGGSRGESFLRHVIVHWNGRTLRSFAAVGVSRRGELRALAAVSRRNIWAVGWEFSARRPDELFTPVVLRWDGRAWRRENLPGFPADVALDDVIAFSATDVWVVGRSDAGPLVARWNGKGWRVGDLGAAAPRDGWLEGIGGTTPNNIWVVGHRPPDNQLHVYDELALRWNGRVWTRVRSPLAGENQRASAIAVTPRATWTVHSFWHAPEEPYKIVRWRGRTGRVAYRAENVFLYDVAARSARSAWAVGEGVARPRHPRVLHWNGRSWRRQSTVLDRIRNASLEGLSIRSRRDIWAAGDHLLARYSC